MNELVITGGRGWIWETAMQDSLTRFRRAGFSRLGHGNARGADKMAGRIWEALDGTVQKYEANWRPHGFVDRQAGHRRNIEMIVAEQPALVAAYPDPNSSGTWHAVSECLRGVARSDDPTVRHGIVVAVCMPWAADHRACITVVIDGVRRYAPEVIESTFILIHGENPHLYIGASQAVHDMWMRVNYPRAA